MIWTASRKSTTVLDISYGDQALKQVAARLSSQVRARDYKFAAGAATEFRLRFLACDLAGLPSRVRAKSPSDLTVPTISWSPAVKFKSM